MHVNALIDQWQEIHWCFSETLGSGRQWQWVWKGRLTKVTFQDLIRIYSWVVYVKFILWIVQKSLIQANWMAYEKVKIDFYWLKKIHSLKNWNYLHRLPHNCQDISSLWTSKQLQISCWPFNFLFNQSLFCTRIQDSNDKTRNSINSVQRFG